METKKIAIYARVSTERQEKQETIQIQINNLREYANKNNHQITEEYIDDGWSGDTLIRPSLDRLRNDAKSGKWAAVLIYDPDRLARRYSYQELVMDELKNAGVQVMFMTVKAPENSEERILSGVRGLFAEYEREKIKERFRLGKLRKVNNGIVLNEAPYGYRYVKRNENTPGFFEIVEDEARIVRMLFNWIEEGLTIRKVIKRLQENQVVPKRSKRGVWASGRLSRLLRNTTYYGQATWRRSIAVEAGIRGSHAGYKRIRKSSRRIRPQDEWIFIPVPPIITKDQFDRVQIQLQRNFEILGRHKKYSYLLSGLIYCPCGKRRAGETIKKYNINTYYRCTGRILHYPNYYKCQYPVVNGNKVETLVWEEIEKYLTSSDLLHNQAKRYLDSEYQNKETLRASLPGLAKDREKLLSKIDKFNFLFAEGEITFEQLRQYTSSITIALEQLSDEITSHSVNASSSNFPPDERSIRNLVAQTKSKIKDLSFDARRAIVLKVVEKIVADKEHITIKGCITFNSNGELCSDNRNSENANQTGVVMSIPFEWTLNM